jgi:hypothetical protein
MTNFVFLKLKPSPDSSSDVHTARKRFEAAVSFMTALGGLLAMNNHRIALEIAARDGLVSYILAVPQELKLEIIQQLYATIPSCEVVALDEWSVFDIQGEMAGASVQFSPPEEVLRSDEFSGHDPLGPVLEIMDTLPASERLTISVVLEPSESNLTLAQKSLALVGDALLGFARDTIAGSHIEPKQNNETEKVDVSTFRANLRVIALASSSASAEHLVKRTANAFHGFTVPGKSKIRYSTPSNLDGWLKKSLRRQFDHRTNFYLTSNEAANLYHAPLKPRQLSRLDMVKSTHLPIPESISREGLLVGFGAYRDQHVPVRLSDQTRLRHTYVIGQTGTGKSTLLQASILQDMQAGQGCCFIDPHGEVIDWLLPRIPSHRAKDVILFDPSDPQALLGLNLLEWRTPAERDLLIQELILLFYKLFDPNHTGIIGPQFEHWLRAAALTVTEPSVRGTIADIPKLFTDQGFSRQAVSRSKHPAVRDFWLNQMAQTADFHKSEMLNYFTSKFGSFLGNEVMHQILSQRTSAFDMRILMDRRKILLVNLSKGKLGSLNSALLGTLIIAKLQMAALSRADTAPQHRAPFYVYIDEFQNIVTDSFAAMLSEIRKYGVGLTLAHQYVDQLPDSVKSAVTGNVGTLMAFRLGQTDASWLAPHFAPLAPEDLTNIEPYHYHLRTLSGGSLTTPFTIASPRVEAEARPALEQALRNRVRQFVASARAA